jgi:hypothetical protein
MKFNTQKLLQVPLPGGREQFYVKPCHRIQKDPNEIAMKNNSFYQT